MIGGPGVDLLFGQGGNDILVGGSAAVRNPSTDSLRKVLTDWDPAVDRRRRVRRPPGPAG